MLPDVVWRERLQNRSMSAFGLALQRRGVKGE